MKTRNVAIFILVLALTGGGIWYFWNNSQSEQEGVITDGDKTYISQDKNVCGEILWTCPPKEIAFQNEKGCGCEPTELADDIEYRSLDSLVQRYLASKVMQPSFGGKVFADFRFLDNVPNEETGNVEYNIWALVSEYYPNEDGTKIKQGAAQSIPVKIEFEETGRAYIIRGHELPLDGEDYATSIKEIFSPEAQDWILAQDHSVVIQNLISSVRSQASMSYRLPIDDSDTLQENGEVEEENTENNEEETPAEEETAEDAA